MTGDIEGLANQSFAPRDRSNVESILVFIAEFDSIRSEGKKIAFKETRDTAKDNQIGHDAVRSLEERDTWIWTTSQFFPFDGREQGDARLALNRLAY